MGGSGYFWNFHPEPWGNGIQFDLRIFLRWVGSTTNQGQTGFRFESRERSPERIRPFLGVDILPLKKHREVPFKGTFKGNQTHTNWQIP